MATYVLSDIHGHRAAFEKALALIEPDENDRIYLLGDMVDRGPDPVGVMRLAHNNPYMTVLKGNHEAMMLDCLDNPEDTLQWGTWVLRSLNARAERSSKGTSGHEVKISRGLLYYHFKNKEDILYCIINRYSEPLLRQLEHLTYDESKSALEKIRSFVTMTTISDKDITVENSAVGRHIAHIK